MIDTLRIPLPAWLAAYDDGAVYPTLAARMALVVALAKRNVPEGTGGPFAAAVFEAATGKLVAPGVNLVLSSRLSVAHAEIVALSAAQTKRGDFRLGAPGRPALQLVTSTAPCAMCLGAVPWSGVRSLVCGARDEDARAIGFDEGDKPAGWRAYLAARGIEVVEDVLRAEAAAVLRAYKDAGGEIYNG
jgi:tRNA(Arg) A34 adenosine deaminase TadA